MTIGVERLGINADQQPGRNRSCPAGTLEETLQRRGRGERNKRKYRSLTIWLVQNAPQEFETHTLDEHRT